MKQVIHFLVSIGIALLIVGGLLLWRGDPDREMKQYLKMESALQIITREEGAL